MALSGKEAPLSGKQAPLCFNRSMVGLKMYYSRVEM